MPDKEQKVCHVCVPQTCNLFKKGICKGMVEEGEYAVAKASLRILEGLVNEKPKAQGGLVPDV